MAKLFRFGLYFLSIGLAFFSVRYGVKKNQEDKGVPAPIEMIKSEDKRSTLSGPAFLPEIITLREMLNSDLKELVDEELVFIDGQGQEWKAPQGTLTDGASVPRLALWVTDGRFDPGFLKAAVIHDAYCQSDNAERCPEQYKKRPWREVHRMFFEACIAGGTDPLRAKLMFAAVWMGGPRWDDPESSLEDIPQAFLIEEYEQCRQWIELEDPSIEEIELRLVEHEEILRQRANLSL